MLDGDVTGVLFVWESMEMVSAVVVHLAQLLKAYRDNQLLNGVHRPGSADPRRNGCTPLVAPVLTSLLDVGSFIVNMTGTFNCK